MSKQGGPIGNTVTFRRRQGGGDGLMSTHGTSEDGPLAGCEVERMELLSVEGPDTTSWENAAREHLVRLGYRVDVAWGTSKGTYILKASKALTPVRGADEA